MFQMNFSTVFPLSYPIVHSIYIYQWYILSILILLWCIPGGLWKHNVLYVVPTAKENVKDRNSFVLFFCSDERWFRTMSTKKQLIYSQDEKMSLNF